MLLAPERPQRVSKPVEETKPKPPERPPPPKIFGPEDDPSAKVDLPEAPTDEPEVNMQPRNPRLYELVSMSQDTSFWWDSVDAEEGCEFTGGLPGNLEDQFAAGLEVGSILLGGLTPLLAGIGVLVLHNQDDVALYLEG